MKVTDQKNREITLELSEKEATLLYLLLGNTTGVSVILQNMYDELSKLNLPEDEYFVVEECADVREL